jgi:nondiscriminating glutamyl-tRNA synthetase
MSIRVRFAPSPTGYLHIGGARTALYNYFYAKAKGGTFILRIEDTDLERSKREYEELQIKDLKWLGIDYDEGPDRPGKYGPYRQSERLDIYMKYGQKLVEQGLAYYDFCTDQELEQMKEKAMRESRPPHYEGKWRNPEFFEEAAARLAAGEKAAIRFRAPNKAYVLQDHVRGRVVFPENMVGDFVIIRSSGLPVYNYCCVIDDMLMDITHVIRGEDHLSNTVRQLMIYEALGAKPPEFAHLSLLINADRQKLSKRDGATSLTNYIEDGYLPDAVANYLTLLGWSHPGEKDIFTKEELYGIFDINRFSKSPAIYDIEKFKWVNGQHVKLMSDETLIGEVLKLSPDHQFHQMNQEWKVKACHLVKGQIQFVKEFLPKIDELIFNVEVDRNEKFMEVWGWETTPKIAAWLKTAIDKATTAFFTQADFEKWLNDLKTEMNIKGKPLFMGSRVSLTGHDHGPELKDLIPLTPVTVLKQRIAKVIG